MTYFECKIDLSDSIMSLPVHLELARLLINGLFQHLLKMFEEANLTEQLRLETLKGMIVFNLRTLRLHPKVMSESENFIVDNYEIEQKSVSLEDGSITERTYSGEYIHDIPLLYLINDLKQLMFGILDQYFSQYPELNDSVQLRSAKRGMYTNLNVLSSIITRYCQTTGNTLPLDSDWHLNSKLTAEVLFFESGNQNSEKV